MRKLIREDVVVFKSENAPKKISVSSCPNMYNAGDTVLFSDVLEIVNAFPAEWFYKVKKDVDTSSLKMGNLVKIVYDGGNIVCGVVKIVHSHEVVIALNLNSDQCWTCMVRLIKEITVYEEDVRSC